MVRIAQPVRRQRAARAPSPRDAQPSPPGFQRCSRRRADGWHKPPETVEADHIALRALFFQLVRFPLGGLAYRRGGINPLAAQGGKLDVQIGNA